MKYIGKDLDEKIANFQREVAKNTLKSVPNFMILHQMGFCRLIYDAKERNTNPKINKQFFSETICPDDFKKEFEEVGFILDNGIYFNEEDFQKFQIREKLSS